MTAVQLRIPGGMLRELRQLAVDWASSPNAVVVSAVLEFRYHGEVLAPCDYGGALLTATADVPAELVAWVRAVAPLQGKETDAVWRTILLSFLARNLSPAFEQPVTIAERAA